MANTHARAVPCHTCFSLCGWIEAGGGGGVTKQAALPFFIVFGLLLRTQVMKVGT